MGDHGHAQNEGFVRIRTNSLARATITLADDPVLRFPVGAGQTWVFEANLEISFSSGPDWSLDFAIPAHSAFGAQAWATNKGQDSLSVAQHFTSPDTVFAVNHGSGGTTSIRYHAVITTIDAGTIALRWGWRSSGGSADTVMEPSSFLSARRMQ